MESVSSIIYIESLPTGSVENDRCFAVSEKRSEDLADYVRRVRNEKGLSLLDIQRNSRNQIAGSYVSRIENRVADADGVTPKKLQALALGLQVSEEEIFAVARGKSLSEPEAFDNEIYVMFRGFNELSDEDKTDLLSTIRMLAAEVQRRRPRMPPDSNNGKGGKK
jgi:transcriptional regulator with XRE-family HTH domain